MAASTFFVALLRRKCGRLGGSQAPALSRLLSAGGSPSRASCSEDSPVEPQSDDLKSRVFRLRLPKRSATNALQRWVDEGREVSLSDLRNISKELRRAQRYKHALEISEWMVTQRGFDLSDNDYAIRIDLISKVFGITSAEEFFNGLPSTAKTCATYTALLHSYASSKMTEQAEELFEKIKESSVSLSILAYNEMMTLYMSTGQLDKVTSVVEELKCQKVSPDLFTYNLWISSSAATMDIDGVRRILEEMGHDPNLNECWITYMKLADVYITATHLVNSCSSLVEAEKKITQREWITYDFLIILYTGLGNIERINDIWKSFKLTKQKMTRRSYVCILSSYLMLKQLNEAAKVIDEWEQSKALDFDISTLRTLFDAFLKADLPEIAESLKELLLQKNYNITDSSHEQ
ncbi:Pentatricopeptide repeat-containing protein [Acorus calamus]|uniref:Pentatricopeptide repeat-containing protein n=1 Tax=Acorus calamus TaxID=4465 RepID=A0AAV9DP64_ACOCL|nr:Pentatricopeptide repeat-containing protein [Acorus calamus]